MCISCLNCGQVCTLEIIWSPVDYYFLHFNEKREKMIFKAIVFCKFEFSEMSSSLAAFFKYKWLRAVLDSHQCKINSSQSPTHVPIGKFEENLHVTKCKR